MTAERRGVFIPIEILFCPQVAPAILHTWAQLRGLADENGEVRLKNGMQELVQITGKVKQTLYGHLASLRDMRAFSAVSSKDGELFVKFSDDDFLAYLSKIFTCPLSLTSSDQTHNRSTEEIKEGASKILDLKRESRDPLLSHPAVIAYRSVMHLTANHTQRKQIVEVVGYDDKGWKAALEHWALHGWSPTNVLGMLDSYKRGGKAACSVCQRNGHKPAGPASRDDAKSIIQRRREALEKDGK